MKCLPEMHKAIITGACGTIGRALSKHLMEAGVMVVGIDRPETAEAFGSLLKQYPTSRLVSGNLLDKIFLMNIFKEEANQTIASVFHLAGKSDAQQCEADPLSAFQQNTLATVNVLEACIKNRISRFIFASTSYIYGDQYQENVKEEFEAHPAGIYALSKLASEVLIKGYAERHRLNCYIVRISNVYGPELKPGTVLERMMSQYKRNEKINLRDFTPIRDFIYIEDVIEALSRLMILEESGYRVLNLSTNQGISMGELAQLFCDVKGLSQKIMLTPIPSNLNVSRLVLDNQALTQTLQWRPVVTVRDGLNKIFKIQDEIEQCQNVK